MKKFSIFNFQSSTSRGYTLIELLSVFGILSVVAVIVISVVTISLQGAKKTERNEIVRENGTIALSQMVKNIRYAKRLDVPSSCFPSKDVASITITSLGDEAQTTFACAAGTLASNSASLISTETVTVDSCTLTCSQATRNDPPTIKIQFSLRAKGTGSPLDTKASIPFQSSVTMRNYTR